MEWGIRFQRRLYDHLLGYLALEETKLFVVREQKRTVNWLKLNFKKLISNYK